MWRAAVTIADACAGVTLQRPVGLSAGRAEERECFLDSVSPVAPDGSSEAERRAIARQRREISEALKRPFTVVKGANGATRTVGISTCGLFAEQGVHARLRVDAPCLYAPVRWGTPVSRAIQYMRSMGAWTAAESQTEDYPRPGPGAYVVIGCRRRRPMGKIAESAGGIEHAFIVLGWEGLDVVEVSEAGQVDTEHGRLQCVKRSRYRWIMRSGRPWFVGWQFEPAAQAHGRRVLGWGDPEKLRYRQGEEIEVPEGFE
jgi:hypothetical protein